MITLKDVSALRVQPLEVVLRGRPGRWEIREANGSGFFAREIESGRAETLSADERVAEVRRAHESGDLTTLRRNHR